MYVNPQLKFEHIVPDVKEYIEDRYTFNNTIIKGVPEAVSNLKRLIEDNYLYGIDLYSFIHGEIEVDLLAYALRHYMIKCIPIDFGVQILVFLSSEKINKVSAGKKIYCDIDSLIKEINVYIKEHTILKNKIVRREDKL